MAMPDLSFKTGPRAYVENLGYPLEADLQQNPRRADELHQSLLEGQIIIVPSAVQPIYDRSKATNNSENEEGS